MKSTVVLGASLLVIIGNLNTATADHRRQLDDAAFAVLSDARDLRWCVRETMTHSPNLRYLCRESDDVFRVARNLQDVLFLGRTLPIICHNIEKVEAELCEFEELLRRSLSGHELTRRHRIHSRHRVVTTFHGAGSDPCTALLATVERMRRTLESMHLMAGGAPVVTPPVLGDPPLPAVPNYPHGGTPHSGSRHGVTPQSGPVPPVHHDTDVHDRRRDIGPQFPDSATRHREERPRIEDRSRRFTAERSGGRTLTLPFGSGGGITLSFGD